MGPMGVARGDVKRSTAGLRSIALPPVAVKAGRAHRKRLAEERLQLGQAWQDHGLLFPSGVRTPLDPSHVRRVFAPIAKRAGLDANFPHLLRHTAVSLREIRRPPARSAEIALSRQPQYDRALRES